MYPFPAPDERCERLLAAHSMTVKHALERKGEVEGEREARGSGRGRSDCQIHRSRSSASAAAALASSLVTRPLFPSLPFPSRHAFVSLSLLLCLSRESCALAAPVFLLLPAVTASPFLSLPLSSSLVISILSLLFSPSAVARRVTHSRANFPLPLPLKS